MCGVIAIFPFNAFLGSSLRHDPEVSIHRPSSLFIVQKVLVNGLMAYGEPIVLLDDMRGLFGTVILLNKHDFPLCFTEVAASPSTFASGSSIALCNLRTIGAIRPTVSGEFPDNR